MRAKSILFKIITTVSGVLIVLFPRIILAQVSPNVGSTLGLNSADLGTVVIRVIQLALGFLGLIFLIMILIGGFTWMTSMGNEERLARAKKTISAAIIGTVVILLSWAIVSFVVNTANQVTK
jgi:hypothetical protein